MSEEKVSKIAKPIERVTVNEFLKEKLAALTTQANEALQGIATITKSDVVNLVLEDHADHLSPTEVERLRALHIDQVKLALWLADEIRDAKRAGESVTLKELLERCESALSPRKLRAERRSKKMHAEPELPSEATTKE